MLAQVTPNAIPLMHLTNSTFPGPRRGLEQAHHPLISLFVGDGLVFFFFSPDMNMTVNQRYAWPRILDVDVINVLGNGT